MAGRGRGRGKGKVKGTRETKGQIGCTAEMEPPKNTDTSRQAGSQHVDGWMGMGRWAGGSIE